MMEDVYKPANFGRMKEGPPVGTHSVRKLPAKHARRRSGCLKNDMDHHG
jgi:hypothetical protein